MTRAELEHVLRAAAAIAQENSLVVVGSQAILLPFPNAPASLLVSREVDLYPAPEVHDLAVSKCVAGREKDADFVRTLLRVRMIEPDILTARIRALDAAAQPVEAIVAWAARRAEEAAA